MLTPDSICLCLLLGGQTQGSALRLVVAPLLSGRLRGGRALLGMGVRVRPYTGSALRVGVVDYDKGVQIPTPLGRGWG